jgi:hypothetical protein
MTLFHSIETDLNLVNAEPFGHLFRDQCAIGEEDRSECMVSQDVIDFPKNGMKQRLPPREEKSQTLDLFKFFQYPLNLFLRQILMKTVSDITVTALEIAPVCDLNLKITEGRDRGGIQRHLTLMGSFREGDQIFREAESDKFLILFLNRWIFTSGDFEKKSIGIRVQFVKFIGFDVIKGGLFKVF